MKRLSNLEVCSSIDVPLKSAGKNCFCILISKFWCVLQFIRVIYYQLKFGFQKDQTGSSNVEKESSLLLDESWLSADSFLHHLCKVVALIKSLFMQGETSMLALFAQCSLHYLLLPDFLLFNSCFLPRGWKINIQSFWFIEWILSWLNYLLIFHLPGHWQLTGNCRISFHWCKKPRLLMEIYCPGCVLLSWFLSLCICLLLILFLLQ